MPQLSAGGLEPHEERGRLESTPLAQLAGVEHPIDADFVPIADSALLFSKLLKKGILKVYEKFPHGMCTTHADVVNADLLTFIKA